MTCILGVDIGTTNVKCLAFSPQNGSIIAQSSAPVTTYYPETGYCEQLITEVWQAFRQVVDEVCLEVSQHQITIEAIGFSAGMHSMLAVDAAGKPLTNVLIWSDNRSETQVERLKEEQPELVRDLYHHTGIPVHPMAPFCKLLWFRDQQPEVLDKTDKIISIKEYLWHQLTGLYQIDYSIATATGLFDATSLTWYTPALNQIGIQTDQLSEPVPTTHIVTYHKASALSETELPDGVRLVIGASDGCLANLGAGAIESGITTITIGTSGAIRQTCSQPLRDPQARLFSYILDADERSPYYIVGGPTNNGANVLQWLSEHLTKQETEEVLHEAATIPAGSEGLLFLPYLQGERAPLWDAHAKGAYLNVSWLHTRAHFARAALEGVLFNLLRIQTLLAQHTGPTRVIHANGGFAQSDEWVQMMADIFGVPVRLNDSNESGSIGAILLTMKAIGTTQTIQETMHFVQFGRTFKPDPACHEVYQKAYQAFEKALPS
ncbi:gluconokinase [Tellurirhabdus bombi]|uniref:gluconokinase n=1 Tax=Tellurirhabdus bombi TaxID=2907205 RepID=UPI001F2E70D2|nr:gluconokinase [Tellurirhabdus bombi]